MKQIKKVVILIFIVMCIFLLNKFIWEAQVRKYIFQIISYTFTFDKEKISQYEIDRKKKNNLLNFGNQILPN